MAEIPRVSNFSQLSKHEGEIVDVDFGVIWSSRKFQPRLVARTTRVAVLAVGKGYEGGLNFSRSKDGGFGREGREYPAVIDNPNSVILAHEFPNGFLTPAEYNPLHFYGDAMRSGFVPHHLHILEESRRSIYS